MFSVWSLDWSLDKLGWPDGSWEETEFVTIQSRVGEVVLYVVAEVGIGCCRWEVLWYVVGCLAIHSLVEHGHRRTTTQHFVYVMRGVRLA